MSGAKGKRPVQDPEAVREWARAWAERLPAWSDEKWARINGGLGYRVVTFQGERAGESGEPPAQGEEGLTAA